MRFFETVLLAVLAAVGYGIAHNQVTARVSLEYFMVGHPPIFPTQSPTLLALGWGLLATWWLALPLGFLLAAASHNGRRYPSLSSREVRGLILRLLSVMALVALVAGTAGFVLSNRGLLELPLVVAAAVQESRHDRYMAALWAHGVSYLVGVVGGCVLVVLAWRKRRQ